MPSDPMQGVDPIDPMYKAHRNVWMPKLEQRVRDACGEKTVKHARLAIERHRILLAVEVSDFVFLDNLSDELERKAVEIEIARVAREGLAAE